MYMKCNLTISRKYSVYMYINNQHVYKINLLEFFFAIGLDIYFWLC